MIRPDLSDEAAPERFDDGPLRRLHLVILMACALGMACDMGEMTFNGALSALFSAPPHRASPQALAWLLSSAYLGGMIGAPLLGRLADRLGRRTALVAILAVFGSASILAGRSAGLGDLTLLRGVCGLALGAYPPVMVAYLADLLPARRRGPLLLGVSGLATLGPPATIFVTRWLTPLRPLEIEGWRWTLVLLGAVALATAAIFLALPESPRWLAKAGRAQASRSAADRFRRSRQVFSSQAAAGPASRAADDEVDFRQGQDFRMHVVLAALFFLSPWATVAFPILSGAVLIRKGVNLSDALFFVGASTFGPLFASALAAPIIDGAGRRRTLAVCAGGMLLAGAAFVIGADPLVLGASSIAFGVFMAIYISTITTYAAELYPTASRGLATSSLWAINRLGSTIAPFVLLPLLYGRGPLEMFSVIAVAIVAGLALLLAAPAGRAGRVLA